LAEWDLFHLETMQVERGLTAEAVAAGLKAGRIGLDDLARPAGSSETWRRIAEIEALKPRPVQAGPQAEPKRPRVEPAGPRAAQKDRQSARGGEVEAGGKEGRMRRSEPEPTVPIEPLSGPLSTSIVLDDLGEMQRLAPGADPSVLRVVREDRRQERALREAMSAEDLGGRAEAEAVAVWDPLAEDQEAAEFTLAERGGTGKEEDLDLAAMVDVAFQLIMFFMVTASTIYFKSLEIPPPDPDREKTAQQAPSVARPLDELMENNILVEVDASGQIQVDHEPIPPEMLVAKMRAAREASGRTAMLLMADLRTPHRNAVRAYDAANEIGLEIKVGRPSLGEE
jgi:biopolymer transport protein ExbD